jgi:hypothetical protein
VSDDLKPMPPARNRGATQSLRALREVGASVWLPIRMNAVGQAAEYAGMRGKYAARSEEGGVRVWRIKE